MAKPKTPLIPEEQMLTPNADQMEVSVRHVQDAQLALSLIAHTLKTKGRISEEVMRTCLASVEHQVADLGRLLGVSTQSEAAVTERFAQLRAANLRIRDLEAQLGQGQSPEATQQAIRQLYEHLNKWWDLDGFGHISEMHFEPYGISVKFSCSLFGAFRLLRSKTPVSDRDNYQQWVSDLESRGYVLYREKGEREPNLKDCDQTRAALERLFAQRLPSATVTAFENQRRGEAIALTNIHVLIRRYEEVLNLPVLDQPEDD